MNNPVSSELAQIPKRGVVIALDGPAGAGKSTLAIRLAGRLRFPYINTGLMYRSLALRALEGGVGADDAAGLTRLARRISFALGGSPVPSLLVEGKAPDEALVSAAVEEIVSRIARHPRVREVMRRAQRQLGAGGCVMEGRDIGTVVFPDADVKFFLSAPEAVRAIRRETERGGGGAVADRDSVDARTNPLEPAPDAHVLDTSVLSREGVFRAAVQVVDDVLGRRSR